MSRREIAVVIPHLGLYGGNLRYIELGNALARRGVDFTIATPEATVPDYMDYHARVATFDELRADPPDVLLASEQSIFEEFLAFPAGKHVFYFIIPKTKEEAEVARAGREGRVHLLANSTGLVERLRRLYRVEAEPVIGGVNTQLFHPPQGEADLARLERKPDGRFRVLANGRFSRRRKGSRIVVHAVNSVARRHPGMEVSFFDTSTVHHRAGLPEDLRSRARVRLTLDIPRTELRYAYASADLFVSAEKGAGWSNTTIEAMACGVPVVCTESGTTDFAHHGETAWVVRRNRFSVAAGIRRLREDAELRNRLAAAGLARAREYSWDRTAERFLEALGVEYAADPGGSAASETFGARNSS